MKFDPAECLTSPEAQAELYSEAFQSGDPKFIDHVLGTVARSRGTPALTQHGYQKSNKEFQIPLK